MKSKISMTLEFNDLEQLEVVKKFFKYIGNELCKKDRAEWDREDYILNDFIVGFLNGTSY